MPYWVYILSSQRNGTLYVGITSNLIRRVWEHREGVSEGFTRCYGIKALVHFEGYVDVRNALQRGKNLKHWPRKWKLDLIEKSNPHWRDLYDDIAS